MVCGCIDIGSNTTRVLVADAGDGRLREVLQRRAFTRIGKGLKPGAEIPRAKIEEVADVVASHRALAEEAGAHPVRTVATAAIRSAANREEFVDVVCERGGVEVSILEGEEEARLAFLGATRTLGHRLEGRVGVVDVGGGSTEIAVGTVEGGVTWWASFRLGSGHLADEHLRSDPPTAAELAVMHAHAVEVLETIAVPRPGAAVAVGGSAASLRRLVGGKTLNEGTLRRALDVLAQAPVSQVAERLALDPERVRLMPAGMVILAAATQCLGCNLTIGNGGLREGVLLELAGGMIGGDAWPT
jgi:exopolyphosphatase/guanosine-5'-triphosphate,3'-diphosphate pyrophosphatase